jgi:hypothetical protein
LQAALWAQLRGYPDPFYLSTKSRAGLHMAAQVGMQVVRASTVTEITNQSLSVTKIT